MKKALKVSGIIFICIFILLLILPFFFKGPLVKKVNDAANSSLNAKFSVGDYSLSLLRSFPNFSLGISDLSLSGVGIFEKDTLAKIPDIYVTVDLFSVFRGDGYEIKSVTIKNPRFLLKALKDGAVNWNITKPSVSTTDKNQPASKFKLTLKRLIIKNGELVYDDAGMNMLVKLEGINHKLTGDLTADLTTLSTKTMIDALTVEYGGVRYFNKTKTELNSDLEADLKNMKFTFKTGDITLNTLPLKVTGWFGMPANGYDMDMKFNAPTSDFKNFLSLIPAVYSTSFDKLKASGNLAISGFVKGHYSDTSMPSFGANIVVDKGTFQYEGLPAAVTNVNLKANINKPDGGVDLTVVNLKTLHFQVLNNVMDMNMLVTNPVSDPHIVGAAKGKLNLGDLRKVYPMEQTSQLTGNFDMDVKMDGRLSSVEKNRYQDFKAIGYMVVQGLKYGGKEVPKPVEVKYGRLDFSPASLNLSKTDLKIGASDVTANGKIENYLGYFFNKGKLKGSLTTQSNFLNLDELMSSTDNKSSTPTKSSSTSTAKSTNISIPSNLDLTLNTSVKSLKYKKMNIQNVAGSVSVVDAKAIMKNVKMQLLNGDVTLNGALDTHNPAKPSVDFDMNINAFDIQKVASTFLAVSTFAPIAQKAAGTFSSKLKFKGDLGANMMPEMGTLNCAGSLLTSQLRIDNVNTLDKLAQLLKINKLKNLAVDKLNLSFDLVNGKLFVKPFDFTAAGIKANLGGSTSLNKSIDYVLSLNIPRSLFGGAANNLLTKMVNDVNKKGANFSLGETVKVNVLIGGTLTNPVLKTGLKEGMGNITETLKAKVQNELTKKKQEVGSKAIAEANAKAQAVLEQAQKQCDAIMAEAKSLAEKGKTEANLQIDKLTAEGEKKGALAAFGTKKVADKLRKEADNKSNQILTAAQSRCDVLMAKARQEAESLKQSASAKVGI